MSYNTKNYTEQGGERTVIGGVLEIKEGASVTGLPTAENQSASTATTVAGVKDDLNALLIKLKDTGLMNPDTWNVSAANVTVSLSEDMTANQGKAESVALEDDVITITVPVDKLVSYASSNPAQGTHKWIGVLITTGHSDILGVSYNGYQLQAEDVTEAKAFGGVDGDFILWLKCDEIIETPKTFVLSSPGYEDKTFIVIITEPETEE